MARLERTARRFAVPALAALAASAVAVGAAGLSDNGASRRHTAQPAAFFSPAQIDAARSSLGDAMQLRQHVLVPSNAAPDHHPNASDLDDLTLKGDGALGTRFEGAALTKEKSTLRAAQAAEAAPSFLALDGGADQLQITTTPVDETTMTFTGTVRAWSKTAQVQPTRVVEVTPSNVLDITGQLTLRGGQWRVSNFDWSFHPGSEP